MALQGTLDTFALADVLRLLAATTKTGRLQIDGDRGGGSIWLVDGAVVAGIVDLHHPAGSDGIVPCTEPSDVVFELLRHVEGTFEFLPDEHTEDSRSPMDVDEVVESAEQKLADWRAVEAVVPSLGHWVTLAGEIDEEIVIGRDAWKTVLAIGEGRSVSQVGERLGMGEIAVSTAVRVLVDERLAVIVEAVEERAPEETRAEDTRLEEPRLEVTGEPAAAMTLEDVVADLGASPELDVVVQAELAPGEVVVDPSSLGGSRAVDLDTALDTDETGHAYLAEDAEAAVAGPEPLPAELYSETETALAESESVGEAPDTETSPADPQSLAQMSPRAAEAITAAEGGAPVAQAADAQTEATADASEAGDDAEAEGEGEGEDGEQPMNRNLLMKFISSK